MSDIVKQKRFSLIPENLAQAMEFAQLMAKSDFVPKEMKGRPENILLAVQMGLDVGLNPIQSVQNIAVINGRPAVYGDAYLAIIQSSKHYEYHKEWFDDDTMTAHCIMKRKGSDEHHTKFSLDDALTAGLYKTEEQLERLKEYDKNNKTSYFNNYKKSPWCKYPKRMLQWRARIGGKDKFSDALKGLIPYEEAIDYKTIDVTHNFEEEPKKVENKVMDALDQKIQEREILDLEPKYKCVYSLEDEND
jgi:hypothetical protein